MHLRNSSSSTLRARFGGLIPSVLLALTLTVIICTGALASYMLTDANSIMAIEPSSATGVYAWNVDGLDQLTNQWWYYQIGAAAPSSIETIGAPTITQLAPNILSILYSGAAMDVTIRYTIYGGAAGSGSSTITEGVRMRNKTAAPLDFHLFEYNDLDLMGTPNDDTAVHVNTANISQWDGATIATETVALGGITPIPSHWEIAAYPDLLTKLTGATPLVLADAFSPLVNTNTTFAFQWDLTIPAGATQILSKSRILMRSGSIGDTVWYDKDGDGLQGPDEKGIPGVTVNLEADLNGDGVTDYTSTAGTDANGYYLFANLPAGHYTITVDASTLPAGVVQTYDLDGLDTPNTATIDLQSGEVNLDVDFGYKGNGSLAGTIFRDCNANHAYETGEAGMGGLTVVLTDTAGNVVDTTTTDSSGAYFFDSLPAGQFSVTVNPAPAGYTPTYDIDGVLDNTTTVTLAVEEDRTHVDFGYTGNLPSVDIVKTGPATAKVGDMITFHFKVTNTGNTCLYGGVTVNDPLLGGNIWHKTPVAPGEVNEFDATYVIKSTDPDQLVNCATAIGCPPLGPKVTAQSCWTVNIERCTNGSITGTIFRDANANSVLNTEDTGLSGIKVTLKDASGNVITTTTTGANGAYIFPGLKAGTYYVCATAPCGYTLTYDPDCAKDGCTKVVLSSCQSKKDVNFGYTGNKPGVDIVKTGPATAKVGDTITYHFKVTNTGNTFLYGGVTVNDPLLGGDIWHKTPVAPGEVNEFDATYVVQAPAGSGGCQRSCVDPGSGGSQLVNCATAIGCPPLGGTVTDQSCWTVTIQGTGGGGGCGKLRTYTQGGWGSCPKGFNPGALLAAKFSTVYPGGYVTIGGCHTLKFTSACAIKNFLPQGGTSNVLKCNYTNPRCRTEAGVFAGQVLALRLNVDFSNAGVTAPGLASYKLTSGKFAGKTVGQVLALAEQVLGGDKSALPCGMSVSDLNATVTYINELFDHN